MNLAIEYLLRDFNKLRTFLTVPCSLFLNKINSEEKLILTIHPYYGNEDVYIIKKWDINKNHCKRKLPPFTDFKVNKDKIFKDIVLEDYEPLDYFEKPYMTGYKQSSDPPLSLKQQNDYKNCLDTFFNNHSHAIIKEN